MSTDKYLHEFVGSILEGAAGVTVPVQHEFVKSGKFPWAVPLVS